MLSCIGSQDTKQNIMSAGANLLVQIFESFAENNTKPKTMRRLYCESGQAAIKSYRYVNESTQKRLDEIIPKCKDCKHSKLRTITIVLVFEELAKNNESELIRDLYLQIGGPARKAYLVCNQRTQSAIQKLGLQEIYVERKSHQIKPNNN